MAHSLMACGGLYNPHPGLDITVALLLHCPSGEERPNETLYLFTVPVTYHVMSCRGSFAEA